MATQFELKGLGPVLARMKSLPLDLQKKGMKAAVRAGATVIAKAAKVKAQQLDRPETPLKIADNIGVQYATKLSKRIGGVAYRVGVIGGAKEAPGVPWYWRFLEFGVPSNNVPARPFLIPAMEESGDEAMAAVVKGLDKAITRIVKKQGALP